MARHPVLGMTSGDLVGLLQPIFFGVGFFRLEAAMSRHCCRHSWTEETLIVPEMGVLARQVDVSVTYWRGGGAGAGVGERPAAKPRDDIVRGRRDGRQLRAAACGGPPSRFSFTLIPRLHWVWVR